MFYVLWFPIKNKKVWVGLMNQVNEVYPQDRCENNQTHYGASV